MNPKRSILLFSLLVVTVIIPACSPGENQDAVERVLIRVGGSTVTVREFHEAFESGITNPSALYSDTEALRNERYRTLNRLTEELIILERARQLGIGVSDEELTLAVNEFKKDFPDDTFEQTLIENGVSYLVWKKGLKRRLLMEKVIRQDVSKNAFQVPLPANDTSASAMDANFELQMSGNEEGAPEEGAEDTPETFFEDAYESAPETGDETVDASESDIDLGADSPQAMPVTEAEREYGAWIARLREQYPIEIDWKLWEEIEQEDTGGE